LHKSFSKPSHQETNDPVEIDIPTEGQVQFSISLEEEKGNERVFEDIQQPVEKKNKPRTPKTPSIIILGPSKRGFDEYEGSNVSLAESVVEGPLDKKLKKKGNKIKKLEHEVIELSTLNRCIERENKQLKG
jgi:hypothetical protein